MVLVCYLAFTWFFPNFSMALLIKVLLIKKVCSWLASLRTWYYYRLCFSFSCSGYGLVLIKESHTLNYYLFLQKFLLKAKSYKLVVDNCDRSITANSTNSEKAIYFMSLMSFSTNKLKFQIFLAYKNFIFSDFTWKKNFCSRKWWGGGGRLVPLPPPFPYGPIYSIMLCIM